MKGEPLMKTCFSPADILLPDFNRENGTKWAVIACDQFTSEKKYWEDAAALVGDAPSALSLVLPEVYLDETETRLPRVHAAMENLKDALTLHKDTLIYLERAQSDGRVRRGIIGKIDLEAYDYQKETTAAIRATEGTVLSRIPPRVAIRRGAPLELPHVMLLIDDEKRSVIEPLSQAVNDRDPLYDFDLMLGGGHVTAYRLTDAEIDAVDTALAALNTEERMNERYGKPLPPLLFAVGDGNHSLASAKAFYEEIKKEIGAEAAKDHPARYALTEVVNLHDTALDFEPIYRVVFGADKEDLLNALTDYARALSGKETAQKMTVITPESETEFVFENPTLQLTVGTLQAFLDGYLAKNSGVEVDYIHGEDSVRDLVRSKNAIGFLFSGMQKDELFKTVIFDGALPRKTFSMGHARDKRYYIEARKIK